MKHRSPVNCKEIEAKLEDYLDETTAPGSEEIAAHLHRCADCRAALEAGRLARELLREGREPAREPSPRFAAGVVAGILAQEAENQQFWRPLEVLASRLALAATAAVLVLAIYLFEFAPSRNAWKVNEQREVTEGFPELGGQPATKDEILLTLSENSHGPESH